MGRDLQGRDLGTGLDQIPSGLYRLRATLGGERLGETNESLDELLTLRDRIWAERQVLRRRSPGPLTRKVSR